VYIPLGGNRVSSPRQYFNLFVTFLISGLWHGANWTYVVWGALHGLFISFGLMSERPRRAVVEFLGIDRLPILHRSLRIATTFSLVCLAWIFFRANSLSDAQYIVTHLFAGFSSYRDLRTVELQFRGLGLRSTDLMLSLVVIAATLAYDLVDRHDALWQGMKARPIWVRWSLYYAVVLSILFLSDTGGAQNFIYFQF
jgi:hypothetical protein